MKLSDVCDFLESPEDFAIEYKESTLTYLNEAGSISDSSRFFLAGHEFGATHLVHVEVYRGEGFEAAWEAWIDASPTIPESELIEAYGTSEGSFLDQAHEAARGDNILYGSPQWDEAMSRIHDHARLLLSQAEEKARDGHGEYPDLIEGYEQQSNATGTGIVNVGHYAWMHEAELDEIEIVRKEKPVCQVDLTQSEPA